MDEITIKIQRWIDDTKYDITQDWCENKIELAIQIFKMEQCLFLLNSLGDNNNI